MFISQDFIDELAAQYAPEVGPQIIGTEVSYFALMDNGNGVVSVTAIMLRLEPGEDPDGPFKVDLALDNSMPDVFYALRDLVVVSLELVNRKNGKQFMMPAVCLASDLQKIREIVDAPRFGELSLVSKSE